MYTEKDLISFGNFVLSGMRKVENETTKIHHSDLENWKDFKENVDDIFEKMKLEIEADLLKESLISNIGSI